MTGDSSMSGSERNPNAITPISLDYRIFRRRYIRTHTASDHEYNNPIVIHIPTHQCRHLHTDSDQ